ncbi:MAG TPA: hypothetical protein PLP25_00620 [Candidatus Limiplasma sp.]|nr:hypothetical protein [Candidatus Limiplasma sp.]HPS80346.1 hypothetical protein [Candidatus Limiplasma sp.]
MKRWLTILLLGLFITGSASTATMSEYQLSPYVVDTQALLSLTFGNQVDQAKLNDREYVFYDLPGSDGAPFCGLDDTAGFGQMRLTCYTALVATETHEPDIYENIEPSGIAKCALSAQEAQQQAETAIQSLGITDYSFQSITAYGKLEHVTSGYRVAYGQLLNGVPVYWAASLHLDEMAACPESNRIEVTLGDSGLVTISGFWSLFTPIGHDITVLSEQDALAAFTAVGVQANAAELCYLLAGNQKATAATAAYRYQNRFINAADGSLLQ